jgi:hypothetical protein
MRHCRFRRKEVRMPAPDAKPVQFLTEEHKRARRIFARLMGGDSMRVIAASENLSLRRVQQIVREQLDRRNANPADDFALLQIARLERALDLIGSQIDAGKPAAAHAFARILDHLNRLAPDRLWLKGVYQRVGDEVDNMEDRLGRLDAAREVLALRQVKTAEKAPRENPAKRKRRQAIDIKRNGEIADSPPPLISEA